MKTVTLEINETIFDKFRWLLGHFSADEIKIVTKFDSYQSDDFDYISEQTLKELKQSSLEYRNGNRDDFEEYIVWWNTLLFSKKRL